MTRRINVVTVMAGLALAGSLGCTSRQGAPAISGPSELSTSITVYANPDVIAQDGAAQSQITVQARDSNSRPISNLPIRLATTANGVLADFGQLSTQQIVTGADGRATVTYTAPNAAVGSAGVLTSVTILVTPVGSDANGAVARSIQISLTQPGIVIPPSSAPTASFTFSPKDPTGDQRVFFDASGSVGSNPISSYSWNFGDGATGVGVTPAHAFAGCQANGSISQTFVVGLTVTDSTGLKGSAVPQEITVTKCR